MVCGVHYYLYVTLQSQREDPDAIYGTVDDDAYATVGDTRQSYYSMVCLCLHACVFMLAFVHVFVCGVSSSSDCIYMCPCVCL